MVSVPPFTGVPASADCGSVPFSQSRLGLSASFCVAASGASGFFGQAASARRMTARRRMGARWYSAFSDGARNPPASIEDVDVELLEYLQTLTPYERLL